MLHDALIIRSVRLSDVPELPAIERSAALLFSELAGYEQMQNSPVIDQATHTRWMRDGFYQLAEQGENRQVGFLAALRSDKSQLTIKALAVRRAFQRRGLGRALLMRCIMDAALLGIDEIRTRTDTTIPWVMPLLTSLGFTVMSEKDVAPSPQHIAGDNTHPYALGPRPRQLSWLVCHPDATSLIPPSTPDGSPRRYAKSF